MIFLDRFKRITSSDKYIPEIDGLRFFAIIPVILLHIYKHYQRLYPDHTAEITNNIFHPFLSFGGVGVEVFFVISGCILGMPFASNALLGTRKVNIKNYFIRRLTRLEPPFIICIVGIFLVHSVIGIVGEDGFTSSHLFATLFYVHWFIYGIWSPIDPVTWSLETEIQFYILAPLLAFLFFIKKKNWRRGILIVCIIIWTILRAKFHELFINYHLNASIFYHIPLFLLGFLFSDILLLNIKNKSRKYYWDIICVFSMFGIFYFGWKHIYPFQYLLFLGSILLFFISVFRSVLWNKFYTSKIVTTIGGMCYSLYLLHYPLIVFLLPYTLKLQIANDLRWGMLIQMIILLLLIIIITSVFFLLIERPCMQKNWPQQLMIKIKQAWKYIKNSE